MMLRAGVTICIFQTRNGGLIQARNKFMITCFLGRSFKLPGKAQIKGTGRHTRSLAGWPERDAGGLHEVMVMGRKRREWIQKIDLSLALEMIFKCV